MSSKKCSLSRDWQMLNIMVDARRVGRKAELSINDDVRPVSEGAIALRCCGFDVGPGKKMGKDPTAPSRMLVVYPIKRRND